MLTITIGINDRRTIRKLIVHNAGVHAGGTCDDEPSRCAWRWHRYDVYEYPARVNGRKGKLGPALFSVDHVREDGAESLSAKVLIKYNDERVNPV